MEAGGGPPASTAPPVSAAADGATRQPSLVSQLRQMAEERTRNPGFIAQLESGRVAALPREHADHAALSGREEQRRPLASYASGSAVMCPNGVPRFVMYKYEEVRRCTPGFPPSYGALPARGVAHAAVPRARSGPRDARPAPPHRPSPLAQGWPPPPPPLPCACRDCGASRLPG